MTHKGHYKLLLFMISISVILAQPQTTEVRALQVEESVFDPGTMTLGLKLENVSGEPITAYVMQLVTRYEDGTESIAYLTEDFGVNYGMEGDPSQPHWTGAVLPGQKKPFELHAGSKESVPTVDFTVFVVSAIFADQTVEGDRQLADGIMLSREAAQLVRARWLHRLQDALQSNGDEKSLKGAIENLRAILENRSEIYANPRVSSRDKSAANQERNIKSILNQLLNREDLRQDLRGSLLTMVELLRRQYQTVSRQVSYDVEGKPVFHSSK